MEGQIQTLKINKATKSEIGWIFTNNLHNKAEHIEFSHASNQKRELELLGIIPDLMLVLSSQGILLSYNQPVDFDLCISLEEILGKSISSIVPMRN